MEFTWGRHFVNRNGNVCRLKQQNSKVNIIIFIRLLQENPTRVLRFTTTPERKVTHSFCVRNSGRMIAYSLWQYTSPNLTTTEVML